MNFLIVATRSGAEKGNYALCMQRTHPNEREKKEKSVPGHFHCALHSCCPFSHLIASLAFGCLRESAKRALYAIVFGSHEIKFTCAQLSSHLMMSRARLLASLLDQIVFMAVHCHSGG
jgi:hypothetical protein